MKLLALPLVLAAGTALAEAPEAGATAARAFLDGEAAALWDRMTPDLQAVLDLEKFERRVVYGIV